MNKLSKLLGFVLSILFIRTIQTSCERKIVKRAYEFGVQDGIVAERHMSKLRSQKSEEEINRVKTLRFVKVVEK